MHCMSVSLLYKNNNLEARSVKTLQMKIDLGQSWPRTQRQQWTDQDVGAYLPHHRSHPYATTTRSDRRTFRSLVDCQIIKSNASSLPIVHTVYNRKQSFFSNSRRPKGYDTLASSIYIPLRLFVGISMSIRSHEQQGTSILPVDRACIHLYIVHI